MQAYREGFTFFTPTVHRGKWSREKKAALVAEIEPQTLPLMLLADHVCHRALGWTDLHRGPASAATTALSGPCMDSRPSAAYSVERMNRTVSLKKGLA